MVKLGLIISIYGSMCHERKLKYTFSEIEWKFNFILFYFNRFWINGKIAEIKIFTESKIRS